MNDTEQNRDQHDVTAAELRQFVERIESLEQERKGVADQIKEVLAECGGRGYDVKVVRKLIQLRRRNKEDIAEEEAVLEIYKRALNMT